MSEHGAMDGSGENGDRRGSEGSGKTRRGSLRSEGSRRRSSLRGSLTRARQSFVRSRGQRGASVETLRGTTGADFEGNAKVVRGGNNSVFCGCFGGGDGEPKKVRFVLVKGPSCFIFSNEDAPAPKYAIPLAHMKADVHDESTVLLETALGDVEYKFIFDTSQDAEIARSFAAVVSEQARAAEAEIVKKRLGHEHLLNKRSSVRYAESVAKKKAQDQPEAPITAAEVMENVTVAGY